jgi:hypothetical protein
VHEAVERGRGYVPADDFIFIDQKVCRNPGLPRGIVKDFIGIPLDVLAAVFGEVEALLLLQSR